MTQPRGLALSPNGDVAVVDTGKKCVFTFTPKGELIHTIDMTGMKPERIEYLAFSKQSDMIISDSSNHVVHIFNSNGDLKMTLGTHGQSGNRDA